MNAEMSVAHCVMVCVVQVPVLVLKIIIRDARVPRSVGMASRTYPVLPLHLGSLASSQAKMVGSSL